MSNKQNDNFNETQKEIQDEIKVEEIDFDKPVKRKTLFEQQKSQVADSQCRHLQGIKPITLIDHTNDRMEEYSACKLCGKILSDTDLIRIKNNLKQYDNKKRNNNL